MRNEPLDLRVYNLAALRLLKPNFDALEKRIKELHFDTNNAQKPAKKVQKKQYGCVNKAAEY